MKSNFHQFLLTHSHPGWHPILLVGSRGTDPDPDPPTPKCRVIDHTQAFRRRFAKNKEPQTKNHELQTHD